MDNMFAFFNFKQNILFGGNKYRPQHEMERRQQKEVIKAYKIMSKSVDPRNKAKEYPTVED